MKDKIHIGIFDQKLLKEFEAYDCNNSPSSINDYINWVASHGQTKEFRSYDEYINVMLKAVNESLHQECYASDVHMEEPIQQQWLIFPNDKVETVELIQDFVSTNQHLIFKAMKELVHNRQVYINNSTLEHIECVFSRVADYVNSAKENEVVVITPF